MRTRLVSLLFDVASKIAFGLGMLLTMWVLWLVDTSVFPVVTNFKVTALAKASPNTYYASGVLDKNRNCQLLALSVYSVSGKDLTPLQNSHRDLFSSDAGRGHIFWGPVILTFTDADLGEQIEIKSMYKCHAFWFHETVYDKFQPKSLLGK